MKDVDQRTDAVISCFALVAALGFYVASQYVGAAILTCHFFREDLLGPGNDWPFSRRH